jgi:uncharacterized protein YbaR (Trm112 family)
MTMKVVTCHSCGKEFEIDPQAISHSPQNGDGAAKEPDGVVIVACPHCKSHRRYLVTLERTDEHKKL